MFTPMFRPCPQLCLHHVHTYVYTMFTPMLTPCSQILLHHVHTYVYTMFTLMFTPCSHLCLSHVHTYVYTMFTHMFTPCSHLCLHHVHTYVYAMFTPMFTTGVYSTNCASILLYKTSEYFLVITVFLAYLGSLLHFMSKYIKCITIFKKVHIFCYCIPPPSIVFL